MGNTRRFNPSRRQKVLGLREQNRLLVAQLGYQQGVTQALAAQNEALKKERPADLEDWIDSIQADLSAEEKAEWDALSAEEREEFLDQLGQRINVSEALLGELPS
jgi:acyl-CoA reductase-like NAD-dependent aldehyde dehydrogenase